MGTTSEKLTYLNGTKQLLKQKINNLGGSIDDNTTFRQYANQLQNVYNNLPKTEYQEGTSVTIENGLKGKIDFDDGKVGFGQASQESTSGTNLANTTGYIAPTTSNGVTYSLKDNVISLNGTASASFYINLPGKFALTSGDYTFAPADVSGTYTGTCGKNPCVNGTDIFDGNQLANLVNRTLNSDYTNVFIRLFVASGSSYSNYKCKLNLVKGTYTAQTIPVWEQYSGGYASPSPNWEQEVKCVAGRNKFDIGTSLDDYFQTSTNGTKIGNTSVNVATATISNNKLTIDSYNTSGYNWISKWLNLSKNTEYTISGTNDSAIKIVGFNSNELQTTGTEIVTKNTSDTSKTFNSGDYKYYCLSFYPSSVGKYFENIQIEQGSTAHPYLPYNTIEEVVSGINKCSNSNELEGMLINALQSKPPENYIALADVEEGEKYTISFTKSRVEGETIQNAQLYTYSKIEYYNGNTLISTVTATTSDVVSLSSGRSVNKLKVITIPTNCDNIKVYLINNNGYYTYNTKLEKVMILKGEYDSSNLPDYEPYITPKSYQLSLGDKKLYDECYIVGSPDNWKYVDNYYKEKISIINRQISNTSGKYRFILGTTYNAKQTPNSSVADIYSNILAKNSANNNYLRNNSIAINDVGQILIYWEDWAEYSIQEMQNYFTNRDDYIVYPLATPIETPITDETLISQLNVWYNAHSNNGTTIIKSNGDLPMIIKVRGLKGE